MADPFLACPAEWTKTTLEPLPLVGLIDSVVTGGTPATTQDEYWDGPIPWLTPKDLSRRRDGIYVSETERTLTDSGLRACASGCLPPATVLLTKRAPVGLVAVNTVDMAINQGFLAFRCGPLLRPLYLAYWLRINRSYLDQIANGSTYPELYLSDLFELQMSVPDLDQQDKVLSIVAALQFAVSLAIPFEQSPTDLQALADIHRFKGRFSDLIDRLLPALFSGRIDISSFSGLNLPSYERQAA